MASGSSSPRWVTRSRGSADIFFIQDNFHRIPRRQAGLPQTPALRGIPSSPLSPCSGVPFCPPTGSGCGRQGGDPCIYPKRSTAPDISDGSMSGKQGCTGVSEFPFIMFPEAEHGGGPDGRLCKRCPDRRISPGRKREGMNGMNGQKKKNGSTAIQNTPRIMIEHCQQDQTGFLEIKKKGFPVCCHALQIFRAFATSLTANAGRASAAGPSSRVRSVPASSEEKSGAPIPATMTSFALDDCTTF